jgi:hypothetical protein
LFPTRIGLRLSEPAEVDMVLGDEVRDRGALCDRIPQTQPGVGYVVLDGDTTPMRVRFPFQQDDEIRDMARTYGRLRVIGGPGRHSHRGRGGRRVGVVHPPMSVVTATSVVERKRLKPAPPATS